MTKFKLTDDDIQLFRAEMARTKPIQKNSKVSLPRPKTPRKKITAEEELIADFPFSDHEKLDPVSSDDTIAFHRTGIQHKTLRKLRMGQYNIEAILDLHGKTVPEARQALGVFLSTCRSRGIRNGLVIHGKGREGSNPILKNKLNHWLRETEEVLAFSSATAKQGNSGAVYVLLKGRK